MVAVNPGGHAFHLMSIATVGLSGLPQLRTVVMREADKTAGTIAFHTDVRSPKWAELSANPVTSLLWYDPATRIQLRAMGTAQLHNQNDICLQRWQRSRRDSRACYAGPLGSTVPTDAPPPAPTDPELGWPNFGVVVIQLTELEWLHLVHTGHQRLRFEIRAGRPASTIWLVP
jgi:pyridoxamine 5'-phosphate oxidase